MLESLAAERPDGVDTGEQIANTRELLGMRSTLLEMESGRSHANHAFRDAASSGQPRQLVLRLDIGPSTTGTVQDRLTRITEGQDTAGVNVSKERPDCGENVALKRRWSERSPKMFFASVGDNGLTKDDFDLCPGTKLSHVAHCFGDEYCLCGVIYRSDSTRHTGYTWQVYFDHAWFNCGDERGEGLMSGFDGEFVDDFGKGLEDILMFVRTDIVERRLGSDVIERRHPPNPRDAHKVSLRPWFPCKSPSPTSWEYEPQRAGNNNPSACHPHIPRVIINT